MDKKVIIGIAIVVIWAISVMYQQTKPVYETEYYKEPTYGTLYYGSLTTAEGHWYGTSYSQQTFDNAVSYSFDYSGPGPDDVKEYTVTMYDTLGKLRSYYKISSWELNEKAGITGYVSKSRDVCVRNCAGIQDKVSSTGIQDRISV